jgi:hypothetical protein
MERIKPPFLYQLVLLDHMDWMLYAMVTKNGLLFSAPPFREPKSSGVRF